MTRPEDSEGLVTLRFDWQRIFSKAKSVTTAALKEILENAQKDSLTYFEDVAEGGRFDANIIGKAK